MEPTEAAPFFSIVMPAFNARALIHRPLLSIAAQTFRDFELIIIDDCSTEPWDDVLLDYPWLDPRQFRLERNMGPGIARQKGIQEARGTYVVFIDSDDYFASPLTLQQVYEGIMGTQSPDIYSTQFIELHADRVGKIHTPEDTGWVHGKFYRRQFLLEKKLHFPPFMFTEDGCFNMIAFPLAARSSFNTGLETYIWTKNPTSIVNSRDYIPALMENNYPMGFLTAYRSLRAFCEETEAKALPEDHTDAIIAKNLRTTEHSFVIKAGVYLYLYFKALENREGIDELIERARVVCARVLGEMRLIDRLNAITSREEWFQLVLDTLAGQYRTVLHQEPETELDESFPAWVERILATGETVTKGWLK